MKRQGGRIGTLCFQLIAMSALLVGQAANGDDLRYLSLHRQWSHRPKDLIVMGNVRNGVSVAEPRGEYFKLLREFIKSPEDRQILDECLDSKQAGEEASFENILVGLAVPDRLFEVEPSGGEQRRLKWEIVPSDVQPNQFPNRESFSSGVYIWDKAPQVRPFPTIEPE